MARQQAIPLLIDPNGEFSALRPLPLGSGEGAVSEDDVQSLVHAHPTCLPIAEIDPVFANPVPVCRELQTPAGPLTIS